MFSGMGRFPLILIAAATLGCSPKVPRTESVLAESVEDPRHTALLGSARAARVAASESDGNADAQVAAAQALYDVADFELQRGLIASLDREPASSVDAMLARTEGLGSELKSRVGSLAESGATFAARAIELDESRADARFLYATCLGLATWSRGAVAAVLQGRASKVSASIVRIACCRPVGLGDCLDRQVFVVLEYLRTKFVAVSVAHALFGDHYSHFFPPFGLVNWLIG